MAVAADIEWKLEAAFIPVLGDAPDLAGTTIVRWQQDADITYPSIAVGCSGAVDEEGWAASDYNMAFVDLFIYTYVQDDPTGSIIKDLLGAVRDTVYGPTFVANLTGAVAGLTVYGILIEEPTVISDDARTRERTLTVTVHARARDIG